jgi:hypothetical protein
MAQSQLEPCVSWRSFSDDGATCGGYRGRSSCLLKELHSYAGDLIDLGDDGTAATHWEGAAATGDFVGEKVDDQRVDFSLSRGAHTRFRAFRPHSENVGRRYGGIVYIRSGILLS